MTPKEIRPENPVIVLIIATSSGEVDWILPVLKMFLGKNRDWRLVTVFGHKVVYDKFRLSNQILFNEFSQISALNLVPQELDALFTDKIQPEQVKLIFKDYNKDEFTPVKAQVAEKCPDAMVVNFPHSCHIYSRSDKDRVYPCEQPDAFSKHDIFLLDSDNDIPHWSKSVDVKKIRTLGYPRYDSWWVDHFIKDQALLSTTEFQQAQKADKVFFYISRSAHPHYLSQPDYEYLLKSIAEVVFSHDNSLLLIKPHPRQDIGELFTLLAPYDKNRYLVSGLHLVQLSHISDVIISGWSSGILDALAVKKPVIEFWRFGGRDPLCRKDEKGNYTTIYRELGLAAPANTKEELEPLVHSALNDAKEQIWQSQLHAFNTHCKFSDESALAIVELLESELAKRLPQKTMGGDTEGVTLAQGNRPELIDSLIEYITTLVEAGQNADAEKWFLFINGQFPGDLKIINNYSIFLFNQEKVDLAVDLLVDGLNQHPSSVETVMNLIQMLLIVDRPDDALGMVVSFYSQADEPVRASFLQALSEELTTDQFAVVYSKIKQLHQKK